MLKTGKNPQTCVPAGAGGCSSAPGCTVNINDTDLWGLFVWGLCEKRKPGCAEQESGVCCKLSEAGEQQLVTDEKPGYFLCASLGVPLLVLVLHEEIINIGGQSVWICIYLIFFTENQLEVVEGTCTARDVVNSSLCCSGLRKVLEAAVLRY